MSEPDITLANIELPIAKEDSSRVVDAVLDLFSPVSESLGMLGDHVRLYRINAVLRTLEKTKQIANEGGYRLKRPPLNFLVPFLEEASLQDEEEGESLSELWANLLLQASAEGGKAGSRSRMMIDVLARLTPQDAQNLEKLVRNPRTYRSAVNQIVDTAFTYDMGDINEFLDLIIGETGEEEAVSAVIEELEDRGLIVVSCGFYSYGPREYKDCFQIHPDFPDEDDLSLHALAALGLARFPIVHSRAYKGGQFKIIACLLTALGAEFYLNTHDPALREAGSSLPPFEG